jgi:hypothetical protein
MGLKLKHSKIRNTGIIFELLVRQITADTLENKESKAIDIIRDYFSKTELSKEYKLYKALSSVRNISEGKGHLLISAALTAQKRLSQSKLRKEKYSLISSIKESYDLDNFFKAKIENYKLMASIYLLFESENSTEQVSIEDLTEYKFTILENMIASPKEEKQAILEDFKGIDKETRFLVYKILVEKFNDKYKTSLNQPQKNLLREYINNVSTTTRLKDYINEELINVRGQLKKTLPKISDQVVRIKIKQVAEIIKEIPKTRQVNDDDVVNLFNYYQLVEETEKSINYFNKAIENV